MSSPIGLSALVANDSLKFVLPMFLLLALLMPFFSTRVDPESLLLVSIFTGLILTPHIGNAHFWLIGRFFKSAKSSTEQKERGKKRWNYNRMIYAVSDGERNTITLSDARSTLTLMVSASFGAFVVAALSYLPFHIGPPGESLNGEYLVKLATVPIPLLGGAESPVWVAVVFGLVMCVGAIRQHIRQQSLLFGVEYPELARKMHIANKNVAKAVWGSVSPAPKVDGISAELQSAAGETLSEACVAEDGEFTFEVHPDTIVGDKIKIAVTEKQRQHTQEFPFNKGLVPEFRISMPPAPAE